MDKKMKTAGPCQTRRSPKCVDAEQLNISESKSANTKSQGQIQPATESGWIKLSDAAEILVARIAGAT